MANALMWTNILIILENLNYRLLDLYKHHQIYQQLQKQIFYLVLTSLNTFYYLMVF